jgi:hypothetical protein
VTGVQVIRQQGYGVNVGFVGSDTSTDAGPAKVLVDQPGFTAEPDHPEGSVRLGELCCDYDVFAERAAIFQYEQGLTPEDAEAAARRHCSSQTE